MIANVEEFNRVRVVTGKLQKVCVREAITRQPNSSDCEIGPEEDCMPTAPLIAAAFAASMVTCLAPEQDCAALTTSAIDSRCTGLYTPNSCVIS
jgi:hypothetical protein